MINMAKIKEVPIKRGRHWFRVRGDTGLLGLSACVTHVPPASFLRKAARGPSEPEAELHVGSLNLPGPGRRFSGESLMLKFTVLLLLVQNERQPEVKKLLTGLSSRNLSVWRNGSLPRPQKLRWLVQIPGRSRGGPQASHIQRCRCVTGGRRTGREEGTAGSCPLTLRQSTAGPSTASRTAERRGRKTDLL